MNLLGYLTLAVKAVCVAWLILMVLTAVLLVWVNAQPYLRRWHRRHGRGGMVDGRVFQISEARARRDFDPNEKAPARGSDARSATTRR